MNKSRENSKRNLYCFIRVKISDEYECVGQGMTSTGGRISREIYSDNLVCISLS